MLKKHMFPLSKGGTVTKHAGKGSQSQVLPSRSAVQSLTSGDPGQRTMQNYAKMTPNIGAPDPDVDPFSQM